MKQVTGKLIVGDAKTHQQRTLLLDDGTIDVLRAHRAMLERRAADLRAELAPSAYVLTDAPDGANPWKPNRLTQALRRLRDKAGYTGRLHDLRHWNASQLLGAGESAVVVAARLGHRDPADRRTTRAQRRCARGAGRTLFHTAGWVRTVFRSGGGGLRNRVD